MNYTCVCVFVCVCVRVRVAPHAVEPYFTLATIYEELEDEVQSLKVLLIATHLKRSDQDLWVKCACLAKKQGNFPLAEKCFSKGTQVTQLNFVHIECFLWFKALWTQQ